MKERLKKVGSCLVAASVSVVSVAASAMADTGVTVDYSGAATAITGQIGTAVTAALPVMGIVLGIYVGVKIFKRFSK
jgi:hypothetical protein